MFREKMIPLLGVRKPTSGGVVVLWFLSKIPWGERE